MTQQKEKKKFDPTPEQQAVVGAMSSGSSCMVTAYAGCAKTTTLGLAGAKVRVPALALAFNKSIVQDFGGLFPSNFTVKTINGLGHQAWARQLPAVNKIDLQDKKIGKLVSEISKARKVPLNGDQWDQTRRLVSGVMMAGLSPGDEGEPLVPDLLESWAEVAEELWIPREEFEFLYDIAREVLESSIALAKQGIISFDDQVYCPTILGGQWPKFPLVMVDEAQDLSRLNHRMLELCLAREGSKLVAVGDPKQAIYGFRGADSSSMDKIRALRTSWDFLPLATTFRCPRLVVDRQQSHAPGYRAWHTNPDGRVGKLPQVQVEEHLRGADWGWGWADLEKAIPEGGTGAVLCRNNAPLMGLAFKLIRRGVGCVMLGREIGKGLVQLSKKLCPEDSTPREVIAGKVLEWAEREESLARANGKEEKIAGIMDRAECLQAVLAGAECRDAADLRGQLDKLFSREHGLITLASVHKAKGREWDLVLHLDPWRIPSKWARKQAAQGDSRQLEQEWNLRYVAETRTKHTLLEANLEDFK